VDNAADVEGSLEAPSVEPGERGIDGPDDLIYECFLPALPSSVSRLRRDLTAMMIAHGLGPGRQGDIALVVTEAASNVVVHAYSGDAPGPIYATTALSGATLTLAIVDFGRGIESRSANPHGFGFSLMNRLTDELHVCSNEPAPGTSVHAYFDGVGPATSLIRPSAVRTVEREEMLLEYRRRLKAIDASLRQDADALLAQVSQALAHARRRRHERGAARR
jgi:serine/threonine-protein kinase RsbW